MSQKSPMEISPTIKKKDMIIKNQRKVIFAIIVLFLFSFVSSVSAATVTWNGSGADTLASNPDNWSGSVLPQSGDDVVFDSTSTNDCSWDLNLTLASLSLNSGYTGTFILSSDLAITGDLIISDGIFDQNNQNLKIGFMPTSSPPTATTELATEINGNAATLNATVNPNGSSTTVYFEWGTSTSYDKTTDIQPIGSGTGDVSVSAFIMGLSTNTTYYFRVVATNAEGTSYGDDMSFTTTGGTSVSGRISTDTTWTYAESPYIVIGNVYVYAAPQDPDPEPTLTIEPGVEVRFDGVYTMRFGIGFNWSSYDTKGRLDAQGTPDKPIIFTSNKPAAEKAPGDWSGISFFNTPTFESILDYVTVEYGGEGSDGHLIDINGGYSLTIKNSTISYSLNDGINVDSNAGSSVTVIGSVISDNTANGIYAVSSDDLNITFSTITNNGNYVLYSNVPVLKVNHCNITGNTDGVYSPTGKIVDARFNWWGDATGPSGQGPGTGQSVETGILFEPWLGTPYTYPFYNTDLTASVQEFSPLNNTANYTFSISEDAAWTFSIKDSVEAVVKTFAGSGTESSVSWDGTDSGAAQVADGTYTYQLESTSLGDSSQSAPLTGDVVVLEGLPKAEITYPVDGQLIGDSILDIQGTAIDDNDFKDYVVQYGLGTAPTSWTSIYNSTSPVTSGILATWNTSNLTGAYYTIRLSVNDFAGNIATASLGVSHIYSLSVSNPYFSPNGDGSKDTTIITASITDPSNWTLDIRNSGSTLVRTFTDTGTSILATWDGKNTSGVIQPEGEYSFTITVTKLSNGSVATVTGTITIDLTPPVAQITSPIANEEVYDIVTITGTASDAVKHDYYSLFWGAGTDPSLYNQFEYSTADVTNGELGEWDTYELDNGVYTIKLSVMDMAGNSTETIVPITFNNAKISDLTASVNFDPASNQSSAISYTLANGDFVTIRIGTNNNYFRVLIQNAKRPAGANIDYWDGRNNLGDLVPAGTYVIAIYVSRDVSPMPVTAPRITDPLATPARFDPTTDIGATISYNLSKDASVTVGIYDFDDNLIGNVVTDYSQSQGSNSVIWDGKNNSGNYVYPGAYRYKIVATDIDNVTGPEIMGTAQVYY